MQMSNYKNAINVLKNFLKSNDGAPGSNVKIGDVIIAARRATALQQLAADVLTKEEAKHVNDTLSYMAAYSEDGNFPWPTEGGHFDSIKMALIDCILAGRK